MSGEIIIVIVGAVVLVIIVLVFITIYNGLIRRKNRVKNAWSQIDVQLKRRYDLIPNLVETCKGYMKHEKETLESVIKARQQAINVPEGAVIDQAKAENFLSQTLRSLFMVAEQYPDLKANQNMLSLQEELTSTENKISYARQHYNDCVLVLNNKIEMFPSNIVAGMFNFKKAEFFELEDEAQREAPKVSF
jgi:LemA protein